ncbi:hypothetical protein HTZ84_09385 [Haloterrigena sp. SYSU A558-1]|uniref:Uncharacterized protein n=1 Tax=Haloterrigena gelatinilytica TaxID=2741724 RepID=A0ABX2L8G8_9EURY|nr:hypothetical protein [Haloterrigena gelatinilytica]NUC72517.1 hypothetical protein [Haloterrigena gelatinilytica]
MDMELDRTSVFTGILVTLLVFPLLAVLYFGIEDLYRGKVNSASDYASFASGLATVILVVITGFYAVQTKKQANSAERAREQRNYQQKMDRFRKKQSLRKAIKEEIDRTANIDGDGSEDLIAGMRHPVPRNIYNENTDSIGLLSDEEVEAIVEYYNVASTIEEISHMHRNTDEDYTPALSNLLLLLKEKQDEASSILEDQIENAVPPENPIED